MPRSQATNQPAGLIMLVKGKCKYFHAPDILRFLYSYLYMRYFCQSAATTLVLLTPWIHLWGSNLRMRHFRLALKRLTPLITTLPKDSPNGCQLKCCIYCHQMLQYRDSILFLRRIIIFLSDALNHYATESSPKMYAQVPYIHVTSPQPHRSQNDAFPRPYKNHFQASDPRPEGLLVKYSIHTQERM